MEILFNDIRYAFRIMRKSPGFTLIIILTLALGIGANTSIFSIVNAVLLRSLPYYDPGRLVKITFNNPGIGLRDIPYSVPELEDLKSRAGVFKEVSVVFSGPTNLTGARQQPEHLELLEVSPNYFSMLGTTPEIGRLFGPQDFALGFAEATVISDGLWRRSYGGDPNILGKRLTAGQRSVHDCGSRSCRISPPRKDDREGCGSVGHVRVQRGSLSETRAQREGGARGNRTAETWHRCNAGSGETDGNGQRTPN